MRGLPSTWLCGAVVLVVVAGGPLAPALATQQEFFAEGNRLYQEEDYEGAAARYEAVVQSGYESAALYYNLGNVYHRLGDPGRAILNYERAVRLDPHDDDIQANLALVRSQLPDRIEPLPRFWLTSALTWWLRLLPWTILVGTTAASYLVLGASAVLLVIRRPSGWRRATVRSAVTGGILTVVLGVTLLIRATGWAEAERAVILADEVSALSAPSAEDGLTVFVVHEGTTVRIDQRLDRWVEVVLADGQVGWVETSVLEGI